MDKTPFPMAGKSFEVDYGDLKAVNAYSRPGPSLTYKITAGALTGNTATVAFEWRHVFAETYVISWQEADGSTVVHVDDFKGGRSLAFFTTHDGQFFRLEGGLKEIDPQPS